MSSIIIEFWDKNTNSSKTIGIGPCRGLVAFLSGGVIYFRDKKSGSEISIPITDILNSEECDYIFPVDKTEYFFMDEYERPINANHSEDKDVSKLQTIFFKLRDFYTQNLYSINNDKAIPPLWNEENVEKTLWDYSYIIQIISCLQVCKNIDSEVKYYCDCEDDL